MSRHQAVLIGLIFGCSGKDDAPPTQAKQAAIEEPAAPEEPTAWEHDGDIAAAVYDQDALEETLDAALRDVMTISGEAPVLGYHTLMDQAGPDCPTWYSYEGASYWSGNCTSAMGAHFDGYIFAEEYIDAPLLGETSLMTGTILSGQAVMTDADGIRLDLSGRTYNAAGVIPSEDGEARAWMTAVVGAFRWEDEAVADTWLGGPLQPTLEATAYQYTIGVESTLEVLTLTGGLSGLDAAWESAYMDSILMVDEVSGFWDCGLEPMGVLSARSPDAYWYQVVFDVEKNTDGSYSAPPGTCDGCGTVYQAGVEVGEACVDVSPLIDWVDQPW